MLIDRPEISGNTISKRATVFKNYDIGKSPCGRDGLFTSIDRKLWYYSQAKDISEGYGSVIDIVGGAQEVLNV